MRFNRHRRRRSTDDQHELIKKLESGYEDVLKLAELYNSIRRYDGQQGEEVQQYEHLRRSLVSRRGVLEPPTTYLTGKRYAHQFGILFDMWNEALDATADPNERLAYLFRVADALNEAIGRLKSGQEFPPPNSSTETVLRIFISHGGRTPSRDRLEKFVRALGADPVIVEDQQNLGTSINGKVEREVKTSHYGVVVATAERGATQDERVYPRLNVIDEIPRLQAILGRDKVLLLLEEGVSLPSNTTELVRSRFSQDSMDEALTQLVTELRSLGILRCERP
jgi:predicted nucleotide-binding protein